MSDEQQWGAGDRHTWRHFEDNQFQDGERFKTFIGKHPHSRRDNDRYAELKDGSIVDFDGHRVRQRIEIHEANYMKCSDLSGNEIRKQAWADIFLNDKMVFRCTEGRTAMHILQRLPNLLEDLAEHPIQLWRPDWGGLIDRKVYCHRDHPGVIRKYYPERGCVLIETEKELVSYNFLSPHIYWFRAAEGNL